ncbi:MAG: response regulator [Defluviitaleaceae bacterium]|nr:response regulator [Defluviitaleaceae bacterium]
MKTVFIVDDNDTNLFVTKNALDGHYRALSLPSAEKLFDMIKKVRPDLILLDIDMPVMDGMTALTILKSDKEFADIPVIFLTAYASDSLEAEGLEAGAMDFITKPFSQPVLLNRIAHNLKTAEVVGVLEEITEKLLAGDFQTAATLANEYKKSCVK